MQAFSFKKKPVCLENIVNYIKNVYIVDIIFKNVPFFKFTFQLRYYIKKNNWFLLEKQKPHFSYFSEISWTTKKFWNCRPVFFSKKCLLDLAIVKTSFFFLKRAGFSVLVNIYVKYALLMKIKTLFSIYYKHYFSTLLLKLLSKKRGLLTECHFATQLRSHWSINMVQVLSFTFQQCWDPFTMFLLEG